MGIFWEFFWSIFGKDFLCRNGGFFVQNLFGEFFWEDFMGGFFLVRIFGRKFMFTLELICLSRFWFLSRFCLNGEEEEYKNLDP